MTELSKPEAIDRLRAAAFTIGDEYDRAGEQIIHTFAGPFGADWNIEQAVSFIEAADEIAWIYDWVRHDLAARCGSRVVRFDVPGHPDRVSS